MSSKRRPVSANFRKDGERRTTQSRPSTAESTATTRQSLNASFVSILPENSYAIYYQQHPFSFICLNPELVDI